MSATQLKVKDLQAKVSKVGTLLGAIVGWEIQDSLQITHDRLENTCIAHGVPRGILPAQPTSRKALGVAIQETKRLVANQAKDQVSALMLRNISTINTKVTRLGVVREVRDGDDNLDYEVLASIEWEAGLFSWLNIRNLPSEYYWILNSLQEIYDKNTLITKEFLQATMRNFVHTYGVSLIPGHGHSYFVPSQAMAYLESLEEVLSEVSRNHILSRFELYGSEKNIQDMSQSANVSLQKEIGDLHRDIDEMLLEDSSSEKRLSAKVKVRKDKIKDLRGRIELFASILQGQERLLINKLEDLQSLLEENTAF